MNCYNHSEITSVAACIDCNRGLCVDCSNLYTIPICRYCNANRIKKEKREIIKDFVWMFMFALVLAYVLTSSMPSTGNVYISLWFTAFYAGLSIYNGWKFLSNITPNMFLVLPLIGWLIYFCVKYVLASFVGMILTPFLIFKKVKRLLDISKIEV
ncbi:hypothetical protein FO675_00140 [Riemerella anatipestifer]|uniref:hypothetical protein n=1 Tax=Riemerella anatipestifer TaxID=34085 RepID=UPI001374B532|nr:hypothetical protein [Riemerella anatipestifer]MBO4232728.1 hypothetical protein [Riemerella anatipestifer]